MASVIFMSVGLAFVFLLLSMSAKMELAAASRVVWWRWPFDASGSASTADPTDGFTDIPLNESNFVLHKPYDLPPSARYNFDGATHKFWLHDTDKPLSRSSPTKPRSEMRIKGLEYSSGIWQFEGYGWVKKGTEGVCVMQVFGAEGHPTTLMIKFYNDALTYYTAPVLASNISERWFRLNVIHDANMQIIQIFVNGSPVMHVTNRTIALHWFQFGLYMQDDLTDYMEVHWKGIKVFHKIQH